MLVQAAADAWKVPAAECSAANSVITHTPSGRTTTYGKVAEAAAKLTPPANVALKDPKDWKLIGKSVKRLDTMAKLTGAQVYGADLKLPGMLNAAIKDCPVFGGKVKSFEATKVKGMPGVRHVRRGRRLRGRGGGRHVVAGQDRARRAADRLGRGPERQGLERDDRRDAEGRPRRRPGLRGNQNGDVKAAIARRGEEGRGGLRLSVPEPRADGADERDGALHRGSLRGLGADAERRGRVRGDAGGVRPAGRQVRGLQDQPRRRVRPARRLPRLRDPGRPDRQAGARHAGEAALVARGGHAARPVSPGHAVQAGRRASTRTTTSPACTCASRGSRSSAAVRPEALQDGQGPAGVPGAQPERGLRLRLQRARTS